MEFKKTALALAIGSFCLAPLASANEIILPPPNSHGEFVKNYHEDVNVDSDSKSEVNIQKKIQLEHRIKLEGKIRVSGDIHIRESATALTETKQISSDNSTVYHGEGNFAIGKDSALKEAEGNIGLNVTAGDHNVQGNHTSIAVTGDYYDGGAADAEAFLLQDSTWNYAMLKGNLNDASLQDDFMKNASGNLQVNMAAGAGNVQGNGVALAVAEDALLATATAQSLQQSSNNTTHSYLVLNVATIKDDALKNATGNIAVNIASGTNNVQGNSLALSVTDSVLY